ncbi:MAG: HAD family hydrolase [Firmicutes bacterium]|nr:HAD family hydrolase [Bacillota bacterium]
MYKILFTDLDDTLLNDSGSISKNNIAAVQKAIKAGCNVVICSGRSNMSLEKFNNALGIKDYTIGYNGGIIYKGDKVLICHYLEKQLVLDIIDYCRSYNVDIQLYQHDALWLDKETELTKAYCKRSVLTPNVVNDLKLHITDKVNKVIILAKHEILKKLEANMPKHISENCCTFFSHDHLFEFNPPNVTKGTAVTELTEHLGIPVSQTIAVGDNENDIPMIQAAGLGVAVKNAIQPALDCADYITQGTNNEDAVAEIINEFILTGGQQC